MVGGSVTNSPPTTLGRERWAGCSITYCLLSVFDREATQGVDESVAFRTSDPLSSPCLAHSTGPAASPVSVWWREPPPDLVSEPHSDKCVHLTRKWKECGTLKPLIATVLYLHPTSATHTHTYKAQAMDRPDVYVIWLQGCLSLVPEDKTLCATPTASLPLWHRASLYTPLHCISHFTVYPTSLYTLLHCIPYFTVYGPTPDGTWLNTTVLTLVKKKNWRWSRKRRSGQELNHHEEGGTRRKL